MAEITTYPAEITAAFNRVTVTTDFDYGDLTLSWDEDGTEKGVTLTREAMNGEKAFDIQGVLQNILGAGSDESYFPVAGAPVQVETPAILSKEYQIEEKSFVANNAVIRKGEAEENNLEAVGPDAVLTGRPRIPDGFGSIIKIPVYEGFPSGFCVQRKNIYSEEIAIDIEGPSGGYICQGGSAVLTVTSNVPWTAEATQGITLSRTSGTAGTAQIVATVGQQSGTVTIRDFKGNEHSFEITVPYINISPALLEFTSDPEDTERQITVNSNLGWDQLNIVNLTEGVEVTRSGDVLTVKRTGTGELNGYIYVNNQGSTSSQYCEIQEEAVVRAEGVSEVLYWEPSALSFKADQTDNPQTAKLHYNYAGVTVEFDTDKWKMELLSDEGGVREYRFTRLEFQAGAGTISAVATAHGLTAQAALQLTGESDAVTIDFGTVTRLEFDCETESQTVALNSNSTTAKWYVTDNCLKEIDGYLTISPESGAGPATLTVKKLKNEDKTLTIVVRCDEAGEDATFTVKLNECKEDEYIYWKDNSRIYFEGVGETKCRQLYASGHWDLRVPSWLDADAYEGDGDTVICFTCNRQSAVESYEGTIRAHLYDKEEQEIIDEDDLPFTVVAGGEEASITYPSGAFYNVDIEATDTAYEHSVRVPIQTNDQCHGALFTTDKYWRSDNGRYGISRIVVNGQTVTENGGKVTLEPSTSYNMDIYYYNYATSEPTSWGYYCGIDIELTVTALDSSGGQGASNEIEIQTSNKDSKSWD